MIKGESKEVNTTVVKAPRKCAARRKKGRMQKGKQTVLGGAAATGDSENAKTELDSRGH